MPLQLPLTGYKARRYDLRKIHAFKIANKPDSDIYSHPAPPRSFMFAGAGWAYGVGCGVGTFLGVGVGVGLQPFFGAGMGAGAFCGAGFAAGFILGNGTPYIHYGVSTP